MAIAKKKKTAEKVSAAIADYNVLLAPLITEKSALIGGSGDKVVFKVDRRAGKAEVKQAVERIYGVKVVSVRTVNVLGKVKRSARSTGRRSSSKKAYVTLAEGQSIDIVEGL